MDYLKEYNISQESLENLHKILNKNDINQLTAGEGRVREILDYLLGMNIGNAYDLISLKTNLFYEKLSFITSSIENSEIPNITELLREDFINFELIGL